jgi:hypothetical protein
MHIFIADITVGNNKCVVGPVCCTQGFNAVKGWDPSSGLGIYLHIQIHIHLCRSAYICM